MKLSTEVWKRVPGLKGRYSASSRGRIRSEIGGQRRLITPHLNERGYLQFFTCMDDGHRCPTVTVHKAVAAAFLGKRPRGKEVNHEDGDKTNNRPSNLSYMTRLENMQHAIRMGLIVARGEANASSKLHDQEVRAIRSLYPFRTMKALGLMFGVNRTTIGRVVRRKRWAHVT